MTAPTPRPTRYGWVPDLPDHRDLRFSPLPFALADLPKSVDLRPHMPGVYDQGQLGSCTANALAAAHEYDQIRQGQMPFVPSRLFIYYNERALLGTVDEDSGAMIRDGARSLAKQGVCAETDWPYDIDRYRERPPDAVYREALDHQVVRYERVRQDLAHLKATLAQGFPVTFGFTVFDSFESADVARSGVVPMPGRGESALGGHAVLAVGYDDATQRFRVRNSWGEAWGDGGYCTMPYAYLTSRQLASDFWVLYTVEGGA